MPKTPGRNVPRCQGHVQQCRKYLGDTEFDNVNDMGSILAQRAPFQANNDVHALADSRTGIYQYTVWLYTVPIVVTVDMSATRDENEAWISAKRSYVFLKVTIHGRRL